MDIGVIGFGPVGRAFTKKAIAAGHTVKIGNSRGPDSLRDEARSLGPHVVASSAKEAASCPIVLLAVPWDVVVQTLSELNGWSGQILIDAINPFHGRGGSYVPADVGNLSTSQLVAHLAQGARVVKAINTLPMTVFEAEVPAGTKRVLFVSGDDEDAKRDVSRLLEEFGFHSVDLGNLRDGGLLQQLGGPLAGKPFLIQTEP